MGLQVINRLSMELKWREVVVMVNFLIASYVGSFWAITKLHQYRHTHNQEEQIATN